MYINRCYYALQGLHDDYWNGNNELTKCNNNEEKLIERMKWRNCISLVLPSSFRFNSDLPKQLINNLENELHTLLQQCCTTTTSTTTINNNDNNDNDTSDKNDIDTTSTKDEEVEDSVDSTIDNNDDNNNDTTTKIDSTSGTTTTNKRRYTGKIYEVLPTNPDDIIKRLDFLPHAYQLRFDKAMIRKHPSLVRLHDWLIQHTNTGYITRQETVSMIPPVILNPISTNIVLDMCAAPGSKTSQILEKLTNGGCIVANDNNPQRAYMLTHQLKRINYNNPVVLISCIDAQFFPSRIMQFDSILCDVPCTGDGTSRKNINIWRSWSCVGALALHTLQYQIAWKGISQLLKVGGYMCYSTCSLNPIENEAVVAELIRQSNGSIELVECQLNGFRIRPGMKSWNVLIEKKTKKQMRNDKNKNNNRMEAKRRMYQKLNNNKNDEVKVDDEDDVVKEDEDDKNKTEEEDIDDVDVVDDENASDQPKILDQKFDPITFDKNILLETITNTCGLKHYNTYDEVLAGNNIEGSIEEKRIKKSCFPPTLDENNLHLERCIRCYPHDNDTGGFFVALLHKVAPISINTDTKWVSKNNNDKIVQSDNNEKVDDNNETNSPEVKRARTEKSNNNMKEEKEIVVIDMDVPTASNVIIDDENDNEKLMKTNLLDGNKNLGNDDCVPIPDDVIQPLIDFYGLNLLTFPREQYMGRACATEIKIIYYISKPIKELIDLGIQKRITGKF